MPCLHAPKLHTRVSQTPCSALQRPKEEQEEGLQIRPRSGWSLSALPNALPATSLTSPHQSTHTTVSWRYFICNLITILIALNGIMMGSRRLEFEGSIAAVQCKCSHSVMAKSLRGQERCGAEYFLGNDLNIMYC